MRREWQAAWWLEYLLVALMIAGLIVIGMDMARQSDCPPFLMEMKQPMECSCTQSSAEPYIDGETL